MGEEEEEINYDENDNNDYDEYNNDIDIENENDGNINYGKENQTQMKDYEILEYSNLSNIRKDIILKFMESSCLNYDEAELVLIHYNWDYNKLIDIWFDETEKIKIESHIEQSPTSLKLISNNNNDNNICPICKSQVELGNSISLKCNHKICKNCLISYIYDILFSEPAKIISTLCPFPNCNLYLTNSIYEQCILDEELLDLYKNTILNNFIFTCKNIKHCPNPKCNFYIKCSNTIPKEIICKCGFAFCFSCLNESHIPINCDMARTWKAIDLEYQKKYKLDEEGFKTKKCPGCSKMVEKNQISTHIICKEDDYEFCWNCLGMWKSHDFDCYKNKVDKNRFLKYYKICKGYEKNTELFEELKLRIMQLKIQLIEDRVYVSKDEAKILDESLDIITDNNRFLKNIFIFYYFLNFNANIQIFEHNFRFFLKQNNSLLELIEFKKLDDIIIIEDTITFKKKFIEYREEALSIIKSIKIYKENLIKEIDINLYDKIDFKKIEEPIYDLLLNREEIIYSTIPIDYIVNAIKSKDYSFYKLKSDIRFSNMSYSTYNKNNISNDDIFMIKIYSSIYYGFITEYLRTGKVLEEFYGFKGFTESQLKSLICCLQKALFNNKNIKNGQVTYRAIKNARFPQEIKIGSKFYFREFMSTSKQEKFSKNWLGNNEGTFLIITIQNNGTNGHPNYCYYIEDITTTKNQYEVLFAAHCLFKVDNIRREKMIDYVFLTCEGYLLD